MRNITRTLYVTKESLELIDKDINAVQSYTFFSNEEVGTIQVEAAFKIAEEFKITEDILFEIIDGLLPALDEKSLDVKKAAVLQHLRSIGASV